MRYPSCVPASSRAAGFGCADVRWAAELQTLEIVSKGGVHTFAVEMADRRRRSNRAA